MSARLAFRVRGLVSSQGWIEALKSAVADDELGLSHHEAHAVLSVAADELTGQAVPGSTQRIIEAIKGLS